MAVQPRNKIKVEDFTTLLGTALYPKINEPDYKWKPETGEYSCNLRYTAEQAEIIRPKLDALLVKAVELFKEDRKDNKRVVNQIAAVVFGEEGYPLKEELDDEGNPTGSFILKSSRTASGVDRKGKAWNAKIVFADPFGTAISEPPVVWGGTTLRCFTQSAGWMKAGSTKVGLKLDLYGVQIKKLVSSGGSKVSFGSIAEDGDESFASTPSSDDNDASDSADF